MYVNHTKPPEIVYAIDVHKFLRVLYNAFADNHVPSL